MAINNMAQENMDYRVHLDTEKAKIIIHINMDYNKGAKTSYQALVIIEAQANLNAQVGVGLKINSYMVIRWVPPQSSTIIF